MATYESVFGAKANPQPVIVLDENQNIGGGTSSSSGGKFQAVPVSLADGDQAPVAIDQQGFTEVVIVDSTHAPISYPAAGFTFDVPVVPTVTNGAYSAGDIMGGLLTFSAVAPANDAGFIVTGAHVAFKAAVMPNPLTLILFNADPTATTKTDNAAYSLNAADAFKARKSIPFQTLGAQHFDHGTPNTISIDGLGLLMLPVSGTDDIYGLLIDGTGVTLTSTSDIQVTLRGTGA